MRSDFYISYAGADRAWAEWIAWQLEEAGYSTFLSRWDFRPGANFVTGVKQAIESADRILVVLSRTYLGAPHTEVEWTAALAQSPSGFDQVLVARVEDLEPPASLSAGVYIDLVGLDEASAKQRLLRGVQRERAKPLNRPIFPASGSPSRATPVDDLFEFDVFMCHNSADKEAAKRLAFQLRERSVRPWLDQWEIAPGTDWQGALEDQIGSIRSAAVLVGSSGFGPWQDLEKKALLQQFLTRRAPVIPVVLAGYQGELELPPFLSMLQYVDFRVSDPDPLEQLIWGITGKQPRS